MVKKRQTKPTNKRDSSKGLTPYTNSSLANDSPSYQDTLHHMILLFESAKQASVKSVNTIMSATYWLMGKRIVEQEQSGKERAEYGEELLEKLSSDLTKRFGRGFSRRNLSQMRKFYALWSSPYVLASGTGNFSFSPTTSEIWQKLPAKSLNIDFSSIPRFPLPWSHYVRLLSVSSARARAFYEEEALRGGWTLRQLDRQIGTQFYERTMLSVDKIAMLKKGGIAKPEDVVSLEEEIKDPLMLEFLGLKQEYSESQLEEALIANLESFLLELGNGFTFIGRQKRLRIDDTWYRVDLVLFHRKLRSLVIIDLKLDEFSHADVGQMHVYLNYAKAHWMMEGENPPIGLILCAKKKAELARYAFEGFSNRILAAEYKTMLPSEEELTEQLHKIRRYLELRQINALE